MAMLDRVQKLTEIVSCPVVAEPAVACMKNVHTLRKLKDTVAITANGPSRVSGRHVLECYRTGVCENTHTSSATTGTEAGSNSIMDQTQQYDFDLYHS